MRTTSRPVKMSKLWREFGLFGLALLVSLPLGRAAAQGKPQAKTVFTADAVMAPMDQLGPQSRTFDPRPYAQVIRVGAGEKQQTVAAALASVKDASAGKRYAILVQAGTYKETGIGMKPYVDLYGGLPSGKGSSATSIKMPPSSTHRRKARSSGGPTTPGSTALSSPAASRRVTAAASSATACRRPSSTTSSAATTRFAP